MQENIETKNIGNRKFIIELRFDPKVSMLDKKGLLAEQIENCKAFNINHWEIGQSEVSIRDHEDKEKATNIVAVTFNRLSFISFKINCVSKVNILFFSLADTVQITASYFSQTEGRKTPPFACVATSLKDTIKQTDCLNLLFKVHFGIDFCRCYAAMPKHLFY